MDVIVFAVVVRDRVAQLIYADAGRVMSLACFEGLDPRLDDVGRRVEVRFADFQMNHLPAVASHVHGSFQNVHHEKGRNF